METFILGLIRVPPLYFGLHCHLQVQWSNATNVSVEALFTEFIKSYLLLLLKEKGDYEKRKKRKLKHS